MTDAKPIPDAKPVRANAQPGKKPLSKGGKLVLWLLLTPAILSVLLVFGFIGLVVWELSDRRGWQLEWLMNAALILPWFQLLFAIWRDHRQQKTTGGHGA